MNEDFKCIAAIAEHGSISKAAHAIHISQPGLSQRLRRLEEHLGYELFTRGSKQLTPTPAGQVYIKYAQRAIAAEDSMRREVYSVIKQRRQRLSIGVSAPRANALLARPIVSFYETHRGCTVNLCEMSSLAQMHELFLNDKIDFAVLTPIAPDPSLYEMEVLCSERLLVVMSNKLKVPQLQGRPENKVGLGQLEGMPFVLPRCGDYFDPLISRMIEITRAQLQIAVRDCSSELALSLVRDGLGASIVPSSWIAGLADLRTYELDGIPAGNVLRYIRRTDRTPSDEEKLFMAILRKSLEASR